MGRMVSNMEDFFVGLVILYTFLKSEPRPLGDTGGSKIKVVQT